MSYAGRCRYSRSCKPMKFKKLRSASFLCFGKFSKALCFFSVRFNSGTFQLYALRWLSCLWIFDTFVDKGGYEKPHSRFKKSLWRGLGETKNRTCRVCLQYSPIFLKTRMRYGIFLNTRTEATHCGNDRNQNPF